MTNVAGINFKMGINSIFIGFNVKLDFETYVSFPLNSKHNQS